LGFSGAVNIASGKIRRIYGFLMYLTAVVQTIVMHPQHVGVKVRIDDQPTQDRRIAMISVCNGPREGGGFPVAHNAVMDDGYLTYMFMREVNRAQMFYFLPIVMAANHLKHTAFFEEGKARRLVVEADRTLAIHADGETFGPWEADIRKVEFSLIPSAIQVVCNC
jgi:diacylglycerol kinase family enzyme